METETERPAGGASASIADSVGVVVIGRNEGERLARCLDSILSSDCVLIYVDSGSTDNSVAIARSRNVNVVSLDTSEGFTAARARNLGFRTVRESAEPPEFVQFVDGDCTLFPDWLSTAQARLVEQPELAVVAGRLFELSPEASLFNRLCDMEWNTPVGPAPAVGGIAMYRAAAFAQANGFEETLICGEEPDLCLRLRRNGWGIERLDAPMATHDAAMTRWRQWFRRTMRGGWAFEEGAFRHGAGPERYCVRERRRIWFWGAAAPLATVLLLLAAVVLAASSSALWPAPLVLAALAILTYPVMAARIAHRRRRERGDPWRHALLYGAMMMIGKVPECIGAASQVSTRRRRQVAKLIEYK